MIYIYHIIYGHRHSTHMHTHAHTDTQHTDIADTVTLTICKIDNNKKNIQYTMQSHSTIYYYF